jgi:splicing factor U2AF subunit
MLCWIPTTYYTNWTCAAILLFVSGLHYHLAEDQVLELLQAFGKVKSFHLVKNEPDSLTSKGYCFVEYSDPNVTPVAVIGLNGMDLGGGKVLTARVAGERAGGIMTSPTVASLGGVSVPPQPAAPSPDAIIIGGYDVEALVDAAMGLRPMPTAPMHVDQFGVPITRTSPVMSTGLPPPPPPPAVVAPPSLPPGASALDIANAALNAAFGKAAPPSSPTRILVLLNMVTAEDLVADEDYQGLMEEVKVPRSASGNVVQSAIKKIYLEYATPQDASHAERELAGRQFGPNVVEVCTYMFDIFHSVRCRWCFRLF